MSTFVYSSLLIHLYKKAICCTTLKILYFQGANFVLCVYTWESCVNAQGTRVHVIQYSICSRPWKFGHANGPAADRSYVLA